MLDLDDDEIWLPYPGFPLYLFSSKGRAARRLADGRLRYLVGCTCGRGYRAISMANGDKTYTRVYIHRAVCEIFNGPPPVPRLHARHLDTNMGNNAASNLAWGTPAENMSDTIRAGKSCKGDRNANAKLTKSAVDQMRIERGEVGTTFRALAEKHGVSTMTAFRAVARQSWN